MGTLGALGKWGDWAFFFRGPPTSETLGTLGERGNLAFFGSSPLSQRWERGGSGALQIFFEFPNIGNVENIGKVGKLSIFLDLPNVGNVGDVRKVGRNWAQSGGIRPIGQFATIRPSLRAVKTEGAIPVICFRYPSVLFLERENMAAVTNKFRTPS